MSDKPTRKEMRQRHNLELLRRMRTGEALYSFDSQSSWYPPRPVIEKDENALTRLYGQPAHEKALRPDTVLGVVAKDGTIHQKKKTDQEGQVVNFHGQSA